MVTFPDGFEQAIAPELSAFHALSARELPGKEMVERLTGRETSLVTDPTWLVDAAQWAEMEKAYPAVSGEYVLYFAVSQSETLLQRCKDFAKQKGIKLVIIGGNAAMVRQNTDPMLVYATDVGPEQWLHLMHHARYVFTNSFHGAAFSVLFERDVYVQVPAHTGSRLQQVLACLGMEAREVLPDVALTEEPVDYDGVRPAFTALKEQSLAYLENALK